MHRRNYLTVLAAFILLTLLFPSTSAFAGRSSIGMVGGFGTPTGWWADRWDRIDYGELNVRYEFSPGTGIVFIAGLGKSYLTDLSANQIAQEARVHLIDDFESRTSIDVARQGGMFKQIPLGIGLYTERMLASVRTYGSLAMVVHLWNTERSQTFVQKVEGINNQVNYNSDNWTDRQDGTNMGLQVAVGGIYPIRVVTAENLSTWFVDFSLAYHIVNIGREHAAVVYWGKPSRTWEGEQLSDVDGGANFLQFRIGLRYGL